MNGIDLVFSFLTGFLSGIGYFHHLLISSQRAILNRKKSTGFIFRFVPFSIVALSVAVVFREGIILFLIGFYVSRLTYTNFVIRYR
ncbi:MAG TPA: hypothetical protein ENK22_03050 [Persephonella sp.]|nr:hypothetical protein [Persephonella sp.]